MQRDVVRFTCAFDSADRKILLNMGIFSVMIFAFFPQGVFAQKITPLATQARSISEYEQLVKTGLPLSHEDTVLIAFGQMKGLLRSLPEIKYLVGKCGTPLASQAHQIQNISKSLKQELILSVQSFSDSVKSPSGKFTIFFNASGENSATREYVDSVAIYADEAFELEVKELGYPQPPFTGPDSTWHIQLEHLGEGKYGKTESIGNAVGSSRSGLTRFRSFITIDNSFDSGYPTLHFDAARITIFHEFHHVIQNGSYGTSGTDDAFREMTAVWMETRSTPWVPDYLQYIPSYTLHLDESFDHIEGSGFYGQAIWMQYLGKKFGDGIIKNVWDFYRDSLADFLQCFDSILTTHAESNFCTEYKRFGTAVYYTGRNFQGTSFFPEARKFDVDAIKKTLLEPNVPHDFIALPASLNIFVCGYGKDTSVIVISRSTDRAFNSNATVTSKTALSFASNYQFPETFCDTISLPVLIATKIFPQPFIISAQQDQPVLNFLASTKPYKPLSVDLNIYSSSQTLIRHYERTLDISHQLIAADPFGGSWYVQWDGKDDAGRLVPTGIYLYSILTDGNRDGGKFVLIRKN